MRNNIRCLGLGALLFTGIMACRSLPDEDAAVKHEAGQPVQGTDAYFWHATKRDDFFQAALSNLKPMQPSQAVPEKDPLSQRLQYWIDQMHAEVLKLKPQLKNVVPKPSILVLPDRIPNAFVTGIPVCLDAPVDFSTLAGPTIPSGTATEVNEVVLEFDRVQSPYIDIMSFRPKNCIDAPLGKNVAAFVSYFNRSQSVCRLEYKGGKILVTGTACGRDVVATTAKKASFTPSASLIVVSTPMFNLVKTEPQLVSIIAHELGHYYRAHGVLSQIKGNYDYFFVEEATRAPHKPTAVADTVSLQQQASELSFPGATVIPKAQWEARTRNVLVRVIGQAQITDCSKSKVGFCGKECQVVAKGMFDPWLSQLVEYNTITAQDFPKYLAFEPKLMACASKLVITTDSSSTAGPTLDAVKHEVDRLQYSFMKPLPAQAKKLDEIIKHMTERSTTMQAKANAFRADMASRNLGVYTTEQEADDFSTEMLARIGIDPNSAGDAFYEAMKVDAEKSENAGRFLEDNGMTFAECDALRTNKWISPAGGRDTLRYVPMGSLTDIHHGYCYRIYNIYREIQGHQYKVTARQHPQAKPNWTELQALAKKRTDDYNNTPVPQFTPGPGVTISAAERAKQLKRLERASTQDRFPQP